MKTTTVKKFIKAFVPVIIDDEKHEIITDSTHKITIEELPNENIRLFGYSLIGDTWHPMASIEIQSYTKTFWTQIAQAIITLSGRFHYTGNFTLHDVAQGLILDIPEAQQLTIERDPPQEPKPRKPKPQTTGTIHSKGTAKARFPNQEEPKP